MGTTHGLRQAGTASVATDHCPACLSNAQLRSLVRTHGTPLLLIDCAEVRSNYRRLHAALPGVSIHYAVKALPDASVLNTLYDEGSHFDVASTGELDQLLKLGVRADRVIHTHPIKTDHEIRTAIQSGCTTFVYDNADEILKLRAYAGRIKLILRVAFRNPEATVDLSKKFGAAPSDVLTLLRLAHNFGLSTIGFSFHVGSQCANSRAHVGAIQACKQLMVHVQQAGLPAVRVLDIGGGFPSPYTNGTLDIETFCTPIRNALKELPRFVRVLAEPGRFIVASAGHSAASIVGKANRDGAPWYYLDDGVYGLYGAQVFDGIHYPLSVLTERPGPTRVSHLAGPTCDSGDMVSDGIELPPLEIGDVVIAHVMGAYSCVTANDFNSVRRAKVLPLNVSSRESGVNFVAMPVI